MRLAFRFQGSGKSANLGIDPLTGEEIYMHLRNIIYLGELSADLVQDMMISLKKHNIKYATTFSYESIYDGKNKNVVVKENVSVNDTTWNFCLTVSDEELGTAFQLFWNTSPLEVIAILQPKAFDFSVDKVLSEEIDIVYANVTDQTILNEIKEIYLSKAVGPAYFSGEQGFVSNASNVPDDEGFTQDFMNMTGLTPWVPFEISQMTITFSTDSTVVN